MGRYTSPLQPNSFLGPAVPGDGCGTRCSGRRLWDSLFRATLVRPAVLGAVLVDALGDAYETRCSGRRLWDPMFRATVVGLVVLGDSCICH
ncbi:unannotated protein [freshwater metagenome]|uniref:Unannotated protein n=1 Tax=freshwater metagenome TaxID=449393 RepID=A0A6J7GS83_9ZZZZ